MKSTPLESRHVALGAKMVEFAGFNMQSVCIRVEKSSRLKLLLLADNKAGKNGVFTVRVKE